VFIWYDVYRSSMRKDLCSWSILAGQFGRPLAQNLDPAGYSSAALSSLHRRLCCLTNFSLLNLGTGSCEVWHQYTGSSYLGPLKAISSLSKGWTGQSRGTGSSILRVRLQHIQQILKLSARLLSRDLTVDSWGGTINWRLNGELGIEMLLLLSHMLLSLSDGGIGLLSAH